MRQILAILKKKYLYLGLFRYLLGLSMLPYALVKIMGSQFITTGYTFTQLQSIEEMPGTTLAWAFLGHSVWFEVLLGVAELIPSILLLFRRTAFIGALFMIPVTLSVFLINFALDLWPDTKVLSTILFSLNILVLSFQWLKIKSLIKAVFLYSQKIKMIGPEIAVNIILICAVAYVALSPVVDYRNERNELTGDWINRRPVEWILEREEVKDSILPHRDLKLYFGSYGRYDESGASNTNPPVSYSLDPLKRILTLKYQGADSILCKYRLRSNGELKLAYPIDSAKGTEVTQYFRKRIINDPQLD